MQPPYEDIPHLLHDARLVNLHWQRDLRQLRVAFHCLRRRVDGTEIEDPNVELLLTGTSGLAAYYSPAAVDVQAKDFAVEEPLSESTLSNWSMPPVGVGVYVNSLHQALGMETACRTDWPRHGSAPTLAEQQSWRDGWGLAE